MLSRYRIAVVAALSLLAGVLVRAGEFDLSGLPKYQPQQKVSGLIRNYGFAFGGLLKIWEDGFRRS